MKKIRNIVLSFLVVGIVIVVSGYTNSPLVLEKNDAGVLSKNTDIQTVNLFVTHGHCSTPFGGIVTKLDVNIPQRNDGGNPLESMKISFEIDPNTFKVCKGDDLTARIKTPGLFIGEHSEKITFYSTQVYTMGIDWYQVNGKLAIKGVEKDVKLFVSGIRNPNDAMANSLVIEGQMNLFDWDIDYDKIVNGTSASISTKWMHLNMKVKI